MKNYYDLLGLTQNNSTDEIKKDLELLENDWNERRKSDPEQGVKMLSYIDEAKGIFSSEKSRKEYDDKLGGSPDPSIKRKAEYLEKMDMAESILNESNPDVSLAEGYLDRAEQLLDGEDARLYYLKSVACYKNKQYDEALRLINKAIPLEDDYRYYAQKGLIEYFDPNNTETSMDVVLSAMEKARNGAKADSNMQEYGIYTGFIAGVLYFEYNDREKEAVEYANEAIENGDAWGNGKKVLDAIEVKKKEKQEEVERRNQAKIKEEEEAERKRKQDEEQKQQWMKQQDEEINRRIEAEKQAVLDNEKRKDKERKEELERAERQSQYEQRQKWLKRVGDYYNLSRFWLICLLVPVVNIFSIGAFNYAYIVMNEMYKTNQLGLLREFVREDHLLKFKKKRRWNVIFNIYAFLITFFWISVSLEGNPSSVITAILPLLPFVIGIVLGIRDAKTKL